LRELLHNGKSYIFERLSHRFLPSIERREIHLKNIADLAKGLRFRGTTILINPPLAVFKDRGNIYVLRRKVEGIHLEEALDQLKTAPSLKEMNRSAGIDRAILKTIKEIRQWLRSGYESNLEGDLEELTFFVPWDIEANKPRVSVDHYGVTIDYVWLS